MKKFHFEGRRKIECVLFIQFSLVFSFVSFTKVNSSKMAIHCVDGVANLRTAILAENFPWLE